jgi:hypothetical protein
MGDPDKALVLLGAPSSVSFREFEATETAERRNWLVNPYISLFGNFEVTRYTPDARFIADCQTIKSR